MSTDPTSPAPTDAEFAAAVTRSMEAAQARGMPVPPPVRAEVAAVKANVEQMEAEVAGLVAENERLRHAGALMSNALFNLGQGSSGLGDRTAESCRKLASDWDAAVRLARQTEKPSRPALGSEFTIPHDGFTGTVIGYYTRRDGYSGVVGQQIGTNVVHVYGERFLQPQEPEASR